MSIFDYCDSAPPRAPISPVDIILGCFSDIHLFGYSYLIWKLQTNFFTSASLAVCSFLHVVSVSVKTRCIILRMKNNSYMKNNNPTKLSFCEFHNFSHKEMHSTTAN